MQVDAVHVNANQEGQGSGIGSRSDKGKGKGGKGGKSGKGKSIAEKSASKFEGECRYCQKKGHKKAECRKMKADLAAGKCDKNGKPTGVNSLTATGATQLPRKRVMHRVWRAPSRCSRWSLSTSRVLLAVSRRSSRNLVHQHGRTGSEDSHGCKLGRSRTRVVGFWIWLDILPTYRCEH